MMLTIQGLPTSTNYQELKRLIKQECNITDFILDSLVMGDDGCKKVRIGVTDDGDGSHLMKYLNGYHYSGHVIRVMPVGKPNQQSQGNFDGRGGYQQRNEYPNSNFGNRVVPHDNQPPRSNNWAPNAPWTQGIAGQVPQHTFPNQPIQPVINNNFTHQPRGFVAGGVPQHTQNFSYAAKGNVLEVPGSGQFHHQPVGQGHFQGQTHVQPTSWNTQAQPVKPQIFDKQAPGYNPGGFNDSRPIPKQGMGSDGYKDYDKGERRFGPPTRDTSPGRRPSRMSPDPMGRRLSPPGPQGRRLSPSAHDSRRMSPPGHQRRMSPSGPGRRISPGSHGRRMSPPRMGPVSAGRGISPIPGRRMSPSRQGIAPHGHKLSPVAQGRRMSPGSYRRASPPGPQGRRLSPPGPQGRRLSPPGPQGRRISPPGPQGRRLSPSGPQGRRLSPPGRRMSPAGPQGRRISPSGPRGPRDSPHGALVRRMSPSARRISPGRREISPGRRISPADRRRVSPGRQSPGRRGSPSRRMSPKRHSPRRSISPRRRSPLGDAPPGVRGYPPSYQQSKKPKYDDEDGPPHLKQVRPAYEPPSKAPNQAMYSGGYRANVRENVQYSAPNARSDPWQPSGDKPATYPPTKNIDSRVEKFDVPRGSEHMRMGDAVPKRSRSGTRDSRSPVRRERSPFKDRYRRHSPSPRSPRRSWALEKRRSPDDREAPPPPVWPGQSSRDADFPRQNRPHFSDVTEKIDKKPDPTWERPSYQDKTDGRMDRREKELEPRPFAQNNPVLEKWKPLSPAGSKESRENFRQEERFPENVRDSHSYTAKDQFRRPSSSERMPYAEKRDFREYPSKKADHDELHRKKEIPPRRDDFLREEEREPFRSNTAQLNKEIEDVYKRVAELGKKAQEYRKKDSRFDDDRDDQFFSQNENEMQRGREGRREFSGDTRFQPRGEETRARPNNEDKPLGRQRESRWSTADTSEVWRPKRPLSPTVKAKRDKAAEELTRRIMNRFKDHIREHQKNRIHDELTLSISRILFDMFKQEDISYIELIIKFNKKYDASDEQKIFEEVMSSFSSNYRKRLAQEPPEVPVKTAKHGVDAALKESGGPMRSRKVNAAPDNRSFQTPRANVPNVADNLKPKPAAESKVWSNEAKLLNVESKPVPTKKLVQKTKILNKEINHQSPKIATTQELKRIAQKYPGTLEKLAVQKKKILAAAKIKATTQIAAETPVPKNNKITKVTNVTVQKIMPQETTPVVQKTKLENDTSALKNKAQDNTNNTSTSTPIVNTKDNTPAQDIKPEENAAKPKNPAPELTSKSNPTQEKKTQDAQTNDKAAQLPNCVEKQSGEQSKAEECSKEQKELDPVLARAVDEEIQDIMIQVWKELPDEPTLEEDRFAVEKLRNEAGDDLRRVLGLNITKRLLNVYNNLFLKMQFTCRPQMGCLTSFLNEYNIKKFKRIDTNSNTFAAQMENIEDFDRLCVAKEVMCGEAKVRITPCYKFTECPANLKTIYDDTYFYEATVQENTKSSKSNTQNSQVIASNENVVKSAMKKDDTKVKSHEKTDKSEIQDKGTLVHEDDKCRKSDTNVVDTSNEKLDQTETQKSTDLVCNDSKVIKKHFTTDKKHKANDTSKTITDDVKSRENEGIKNIKDKEEINKDTEKDKTISDYIIKDIIENDDDLDSEVPECQMEGDEELGDEDILALMSEGVVLDECSGSEDDK